MQADALDAAHPQEREAEGVLQVAELALDGGAAALAAKVDQLDTFEGRSSD